MKKVPKYKNTKVEYKGISFDSKRERDRYIYLKSLEEKGEINNLQLQVKFELLPTQTEVREVKLKTKTKFQEKVIERAVYYQADFVYEKNGETVVEDCKISEYLKPKEYILKRKMMLFFNNIKIKEVYKPTQTV